MKKVFNNALWLFAVGVCLTHCKKANEPAAATGSVIDGIWEANGGTGCAAPTGSGSIKIEKSTGIVFSINPDPFGIKAGDTLYANIKRSNDTSFYSDRATIFFAGGGRRYTRVEIISRNAGRDLLVRYPNNDVCNPINNFRKK